MLRVGEKGRGTLEPLPPTAFILYFHSSFSYCCVARGKMKQQVLSLSFLVPPLPHWLSLLLRGRICFAKWTLGRCTTSLHTIHATLTSSLLSTNTYLRLGGELRGCDKVQSFFKILPSLSSLTHSPIFFSPLFPLSTNILFRQEEELWVEEDGGGGPQ
jgi:hypothetical protein